jgi:hypothetical protein
MAEFVMRYRRGRQERTIAVHGHLLLDVAPRGPAYVVAELATDEGQSQITALLLGDGRYVERARAGEPGLCRQATAAELGSGGEAACAA